MIRSRPPRRSVLESRCLRGPDDAIGAEGAAVLASGRVEQAERPNRGRVFALLPATQVHRVAAGGERASELGPEHHYLRVLEVVHVAAVIGGVLTADHHALTVVGGAGSVALKAGGGAIAASGGADLQEAGTVFVLQAIAVVSDRATAEEGGVTGAREVESIAGRGVLEEAVAEGVARIGVGGLRYKGAGSAQENDSSRPEIAIAHLSVGGAGEGHHLTIRHATVTQSGPDPFARGIERTRGFSYGFDAGDASESGSHPVGIAGGFVDQLGGEGGSGGGVDGSIGLPSKVVHLGRREDVAGLVPRLQQDVSGCGHTLPTTTKVVETRPAENPLVAGAVEGDR